MRYPEDYVNRIIQGDCLEVMQHIPDRSVDMILCDLPYGTTACEWDTVIPFEPLWEQYRRIIKDNGVIVLTASQPFTSALVMSNIKMFKYCWYWDKKQGTGFLNSKKQPLKSIEEVVVFYKEQSTYNPQMRLGFKPYTCKQGDTKTQNYGKQTVAITVSDGSRYPLNIIEFIRDKEKTHPTQKPVALFEYLIKTYTNEGDLVLDNCAGSGTTGVACKNINRNYILIEINPEYCDIAHKRLANVPMRFEGFI